MRRMDLKTYLQSLPAADRAPFAERCGTKLGHLVNVSYGYREASPKLCVALERESRGAVTRRDLRPDDWRGIWPELQAA
jgi:DNA-binding transcriptional regulator YdaS (Cro superfamily)